MVTHPTMSKLNLVYIPQGTVLGPMYNDINVGISSSLRLFADDCVLYRIIESDKDQNCLQSDLNLIFEWLQSW